MSDKPRYLMISGNSDCDYHRMSAEARNEEYLHVRELHEINESLPYDIIFIDSSSVYREPDYLTPVDVRNDRLNWAYEYAVNNPSKLVVIVEDEKLEPDSYTDSKGWENMISNWPGKDLPNIFLQKPISLYNDQGEQLNVSLFLDEAVDGWKKLVSTVE